MLRGYFRAVWHHWKTAMTGILVLAASVIGAALNSNILFVGLTGFLGLAFLFVAGYKAWADEYRRAELEIAKNQRPEIVGRASDFWQAGAYGQGTIHGVAYLSAGFRFFLDIRNERDVR